jgi:uncharacterized protein (TIGR03086 family)
MSDPSADITTSPQAAPGGETIADRYRRLALFFGDMVGMVNVHTWNDPSPCEGWTVLDIMRHMIGNHAAVLALVGDDLWPGPPLGADPLGAWISASDQIQKRLDKPEAAQAEFEMGSETMTFEQAVDQLLCFDMIIHRWDIASSTGLDPTIPPWDVAAAQAHAEAMGDDLRLEDVCGPALDPPEGADAQTRLLAFLGRKAW